MAKPTQWFYSSTAPCLRTANLPSPTVEFETFQRKFSAQNRLKSKSKDPESFKELIDEAQASRKKPRIRHRPGTFDLPPDLGNEKELLGLKRTWKAAGYKSNRTGVAALFYLMEDAANHWGNAKKAWAGHIIL